MTQLKLLEDRSALLSEDGRYRYELTRSWRPLDEHVTWVMLNPSTADAYENDPTIRRCIGFAQDWGHGGIRVANLYALRATDPAELEAAKDPVGPENDASLARLFAIADGPIVCAWGANADTSRVLEAERLMVESGVALKASCLGKTKSGQPRHPLYLRRTTALVPYFEIHDDREKGGFS